MSTLNSTLRPTIMAASCCSYVDDINSELTRKRKEFNLPTADEFPLDQN